MNVHWCHLQTFALLFSFMKLKTREVSRRRKSPNWGLRPTLKWLDTDSINSPPVITFSLVRINTNNMTVVSLVVINLQKSQSHPELLYQAFSTLFSSPATTSPTVFGTTGSSEKDRKYPAAYQLSTEESLKCICNVTTRLFLVMLY